MSSRLIDFDGINAAARQQLRSLLPEWLPGGRFNGAEYLARNPTRSDNLVGSFSINTKTGMWSDFATNDGGQDPISLWAYLKSGSQGDAAKDLADRLGIRRVAAVATVAATPYENRVRKDDWTPVISAPTEAPELSERTLLALGPDEFDLDAVYTYCDPAGRLVGYVARYQKQANGHGRQKEFRPYLFCRKGDRAGTWRCQGFPVPRPLYRLDDLARRPSAPVLVVEGEKTTDVAAQFFPDHVVTTSPNGSKSAAKADWSVLSGRDVVIWRDADEAGEGYAQDVARLVHEAGASSVHVVELLADLPEHWDLADPLPVGVTVEVLKACLSRPHPAPPKVADGPLPLFPPVPEAEPYPVEALGPLMDAAIAISRKVQVPLAMAGQSVLATASLAAQAHVDVRLPFGQSRPASLFCITIAASGDRKTSADNEAAWPVRKRESALGDEHAEAMSTWRIDDAAWNAEKRQIEGAKNSSYEERKQALKDLGEEPLRPLHPFLVIGDLTLEGLQKAWPNAHGALGIFSAEGGTFTGGHGMSDDARLRTAAGLSEIWDGRPLKRARSLDGVTVLRGRRLALHLLVQNDVAADFLGNPVLRDQGLLSRVLVAAPPSIAGQRIYTEPAPQDEQTIRRYGARILHLLELEPVTADGRNELTPRSLSLHADADQLWREFYDHVEKQISTELRPVADFASKCAEHAARIAAVLQFVTDPNALEIDAERMEGGIVLADWYLAEALRLAHAGRRDPKLVAADNLLTWINSRGDVEIPFREILQFGPGPLRTKAAADDAVTTLLNHGWLVETAPRPRKLKAVRGVL